MTLPFPYNIDAAIQATIMGKLRDSRLYDRNGSRTIAPGSGNILTANGSANIDETPATANRTIQLTTSSANNASGGTGAREYTLIGVDANMNRVTQTVVPVGTGTVNFGTDILHWNELTTTAAGAGSFGTDGAVTLQTVGGGTELARGTNNDEQARYICPNGYRAFVINVSMTAGPDDAAGDEEAVLQDIRFFDYNLGTNGLYRDRSTLATARHVGREYDQMVYLEPGQMIYLTVNNLSPTVTQRFAGGFRVVEIAEEHLF